MVDKPVGVTSHDVVAAVRRHFRVKRVGHLGTLDPGASGLLLIAIGAATRCASIWAGGEKTYEGTLELGVVTSTQDLMGEVLERRPVDLGEAQIREATRSLVGEIEQIPPMFSAVKVGGQRLYRLARRGVVVERSPRRVHVAEWEWRSFSLPWASFRIRCSGGTYVRTLAHDLGIRLGTGAALKALRRLRSEPFGLERSVTLRELGQVPAAELWSKAGLEMEAALAGVPSIVLDSEGVDRIGSGAEVSIEPSVHPEPPRHPPAASVVSGPRSVVFLGPAGETLALGELAQDPASGRRIARPHVVFPWAVRGGSE